MDMLSENRCRCSHGSRSVKAFDTNVLQFDSDLVGRLTRLLPLARPSGLPVYVARRPSAPFCETLICSNSIQFQSHEIEA